MKIALIIIDIQNAYIQSERNKETYESAKEYVNYVSEQFRKNHMPVVVVRHMSKDADPNIESLQTSPEIIQKETDYQIIKHYGNSFYETDLENILKKEEVDYLVLCGLSAIRCVLATYNGANERGFKATFLKNGLIGLPKEVEVVENGFSVATHDVILELLNEKKK